MTRKAIMAAGLMLVAVANGLVTQRAIGDGVVTAVTQENLDKQPFTFEMEVERYQKGRPAAFRIEIKPKEGSLSPFLSGKLRIRDEQGEIADVFVRGHRKHNLVRYSFMAAPRIVDRAEFTFFNEAHVGDTPMPGFDAYQIPLRLFLDCGKAASSRSRRGVYFGPSEDRLLDEFKRKEAPSPKSSKGERSIRAKLGATPEIAAAALKAFEADVARHSESLKSKDPQARNDAAGALAEYTFLEEARAALVRALEDSDNRVRCTAATALGLTGKFIEVGWLVLPTDDQVIPSLARAVSSGDSDLRRAAGRALWQFGPAAREAVPALVKALKDEDGRARSAAAMTLGRIGPDAREAVSAVLDAMTDEGYTVRFQAAHALGEIRAEAGKAAPALIRALKDRDSDVRRFATKSLGQLGPMAVPHLVEAMKDEEPEVRRSAAAALGAIGPEASSALPTLRRLLQDQNQQVIPQAVLESIRKGSAEPLLPYVATNREMAEYLVSEEIISQDEQQELARCSSAWSRAIRTSLERNAKEVTQKLRDLEIVVAELKIERVLVEEYGLGEYSPYRGPKDLKQGRGLDLLLKGPSGEVTVKLSTQIIGNRRVIAGDPFTKLPKQHRHYLRWQRAKTWKEIEFLGPNKKRIVEDAWLASCFADTGDIHKQATYLVMGDKRVRDGPYKEWFEGRLLASGSYENGLRTGQWLEAHGIQSATGAYRKGRRHGRWNGWHSEEREENDKAWECTYDNGRILGNKTYYNAGRVSVVEEYDLRGRRTLWKSYYQNGKIIREVHLKDYKQHGLDTKFDKQGNVVKQGEWRKGKPWNGWCFILADGDAGYVGRLGKYVRYKDGKPVEKQTESNKME